MYKLYECEVRDGIVYSLGLYIQSISFESEKDVETFLLSEVIFIPSVHYREFFIEDMNGKRKRWSWNHKSFYEMN